MERVRTLSMTRRNTGLCQPTCVISSMKSSTLTTRPLCQYSRMIDLWNWVTSPGSSEAHLWSCTLNSFTTTSTCRTNTPSMDRFRKSWFSNRGYRVERLHTNGRMFETVRSDLCQICLLSNHLPQMKVEQKQGEAPVPSATNETTISITTAAENIATPGASSSTPIHGGMLHHTRLN
jgi:hypothetical protein